MVGLLNSAMTLGGLVANLGWGVVVEAVGLRHAFGAASLLFGIASLPLAAHAPACLRGGAVALRCATARRAPEGTGFIGPAGLPEVDPAAWAPMEELPPPGRDAGSSPAGANGIALSSGGGEPQQKQTGRAPDSKGS